MYKAVLESIAGISVWPVIALLIFFSIFLIVIIRVIRMDREEVRYLEKLPLDSNNLTNNGD